MHLPFTRSSSGVVALADIGGSGAACAIIAAREAATTILASVRTPLPLEKRTEDQHLAQLAQALETSVSQAATLYAKDPAQGRPHTIYALVHAPWIRSRTISIERSFETETPITRAMIGEMAQQALAADTSIVRDEMCEGAVVRIELNGYRTREPHGKRARHVRVAVLVSEMKRSYRDAFETALRRTYADTPIRWRSHARAIGSIAEDLPHLDGNLTIFDVADDDSSIAVLRDYVLVEQEHVDAGVNTILAQIAPSGSREEALSLLAMQAAGTCSGAQCDALQASIATAEPTLTKLYGEALGAIAARRRVPNDAILLITPNLSPWFAGFMERIDFAQFTRLARPFSVKNLAAEDFSESIVFAAGIAPDTSVALGAALVHREQGSAGSA